MFERARKITGRDSAATARRVTLALSAILPAVPAWAQAAGTVPAPRDDNATVLRLVERSERMVKRDRLTAELRVEASDADPARLQAEINRRMAAALERAKAAAAVTVTTGGYHVYQQPGPPSPDRAGAKPPPRWQGMQSLLLQARDAGALLALAGTLQQEGLVLSSLAYELTPEAARAAEDDLTTEALGRLRQRAERIAADLAMTVERIRDLQVGNADGTQPQPRASFMMAGRAAAAPVAEPGDAVVSVSVSGEVLLAPRH